MCRYLRNSDFNVKLLNILTFLKLINSLPGQRAVRGKLQEVHPTPLDLSAATAEADTQATEKIQAISSPHPRDTVSQ